MNNIPLTLYIHIPFCIRKCPYCDFNSYALSAHTYEEDYIQALIDDLYAEEPFFQQRKIESIFIGGGTPSLFSAKSYDRLLNAIAKKTPFHPSVEITMEINPGTIDLQKMHDYFSLGINRLSIGAQSFQDKKLHLLQRIHSSQDITKTIESARKAGFQNINLDLMYGIPSQTLSQALTDLQTALALSPTHLSWYQLTIEPNTPFETSSPQLSLPHEESLFQIQKVGQQYLKNKNYIQYEVSAYCKECSHCKHNLNYWQFGDYIGIGAGAHGKITIKNKSAPTRIIRYQKFNHPDDYLESSNFIAERHEVTTKDLPFEFMMNVLRLTQGVSIDLLKNRTEVTVDELQKQIEKATAMGLLRKDRSRFQTTTHGACFLNDCLQIFLK